MLRTALKTVLYQTCGDWECFVVDDGSTDDTSRVLAELKDPRIKALRNASNLGMNASRNLAIGQAQGRFITFLDSDDLWLPKRLEAFLERAKRSPEAGFLFSNAYLYRFDRLIGLLFSPERKLPEGVVPGHYAVGDRHLPYVTTNVAILRDAFSKWGVFKTQMKTLDTELFARFLAAGLPVAALSEPLSVRRLHGGQLTDRYAENFDEALQALESSGAAGETKEDMRQELAREVAVYLLKAGRPAEARAFLVKQLGGEGRKGALYKLTFAPRAVLALGRGLKRQWTKLRHHPAWAPPEFTAVRRLIAPLLAEERP